MRKFLLVPGIEEIVHKGLLNYGDLLTCRYLDEIEAAKLVEIYKENPNTWSFVTPKLINLVYKSEDGYKVGTKEEARNLLLDPFNKSIEFALSHDIRHKGYKDYCRLFTLKPCNHLSQEVTSQQTFEMRKP